MFSRQVKKGYNAKGSSAEEEDRPPLSEQTPAELTKHVQKDITYETKNIFKFQPSVAGSFVVVILFLFFSTSPATETYGSQLPRPIQTTETNDARSEARIGGRPVP